MIIRHTRIVRVALAIIAGSQAGLGLVCAQGPTPVVVDTSTVVHYRTTLAGYEGAWSLAPATVTMEASVSTDAVPTFTVRSIHLSSALVSCNVGLTFGTVPVSWASPAVDAAPAAVTIPTTIGPSGAAEFSATGITTSTVGTANYAVSGLNCQNLMNGGTPCNGPFNLSLVPAGPRGSIQSGTVSTTGVNRSFSLQFFGSCPMLAGATWGHVDVLATIVGTVSTGSSGCRADFDRSGGLAVQDIFAFLNAWFAGAAGADFNQTGGITVQDIFDFLNAWFAGCP